jgi:K+-transporting ATPase ATPase B chain
MNAKAATAAPAFAWDRLVREALTDSVRKLNFRHQLRNPVMFVVYVGSWLVLALFVRDLVIHKPALARFTGAVDVWLWLTLLFASFSESLAESQGKAQAASLRQARQEVEAKRLKEPRPDSPFEMVTGVALRSGDHVLVKAGDIIPSDGEAVLGIASVDESAITGESAPVIREGAGELARGAHHRAGRRDLP